MPMRGRSTLLCHGDKTGGHTHAVPCCAAHGLGLIPRVVSISFASRLVEGGLAGVESLVVHHSTPY